MIGIILAGGTGSRLNPLTKSVSKHLLPIYDKPMIYYPLTTLMFAGAREIFVVVSPESIQMYKSLLGDGSQWGISLTFLIQEKPSGIADCFNLIPHNKHQESAVVILGDNFFFGMGFGETLKDLYSGDGSMCLAYKVSDPSGYGVVVFDEHDNPREIVEKPTLLISDWAIPGLYWFDSSCYQFVKNLAPSGRGELEITDLLRQYLNLKKLQVQMLPRGTTWMDAGSPENLLETSNFVSLVEARQGLKIGCPEEVALREELIDTDFFRNQVAQLPVGNYRSYLENLFN